MQLSSPRLHSPHPCYKPLACHFRRTSAGVLQLRFRRPVNERKLLIVKYLLVYWTEHGTERVRYMFEATCVISMDKEGNWFHNGAAVTNQNIALYFAQHVAKNHDGKFVLQTERQVWPIEVEDAPFVVRQFSNNNGLISSFKVLLNDRTSETIDWDDLWLEGESGLYCLVKDGRFHARFNSNSHFALADLLNYDESEGAYYLENNGEKHYLATEQPCKTESDQ